jgi:glycosyltransferase involved in cell wall biosynthesis
MKIALVSPFEERVPPVTYGGIELVVSHLAENLTDLGHQVTLFASGDSKTRAKLVPVFPSALRASGRLKDRSLREAWRHVGAARVVSYLLRERFDVIHNHIGWDFLAFRDVFDAPIVTTLHGPLNIPSHQEMYRVYRDENYVSISFSQRRPMPDLNYVGNVYNGVDTDTFPFFSRPQDYVAFLGRMSPEKGVVQAIEAARRAGVRLVMAAKVDPVDENFFRKKVKPLIDGRQTVFIGEVGHREKVKLLGNARALLAPIQWEEPFGLVFIEAMACGTPVLTFSRGSVPEIVEDGVTGFACRTMDDLVAKVGRLDDLDRKKCVERVRGSFSARKMTEQYLEVYRKAAAGTRKKRLIGSRGLSGGASAGREESLARVMGRWR